MTEEMIEKRAKDLMKWALNKAKDQVRSHKKGTTGKIRGLTVFGICIDVDEAAMIKHSRKWLVKEFMLLLLYARIATLLDFNIDVCLDPSVEPAISNYTKQEIRIVQRALAKVRRGE